MQEWDPQWAEIYLKMTTNPSSSEVLQPKLVELIGVALNAGGISLNAGVMRRHMRAALQVGATGEQILLVLKMASVMSFDSCMQAAPIILEEASEGQLDVGSKSRTERHKSARPATPSVEEMKDLGRWNVDWDPIYDLAPVWIDQVMAATISIRASDVLPAKEIELLAIAFQARYTRIYAPGTRRHIKNALRAGATVEEIVEVLKLCVIQGVEACNVGVPIWRKSWRRKSGNPKRDQKGLGTCAAWSENAFRMTCSRPLAPAVGQSPVGNTILLLESHSPPV